MVRFWASILLIVGSVFFQACQTTRLSEEEKADLEAEKKRLAEEEAAWRSGYLNRIMESERLAWDVMAPLMETAADYREEETFGFIGAVFVSDLYYPEFLEKEVENAGHGRFVSIRLIFPGSPAELAGMEIGDRIVSVNGKTAPKGDSAAMFALKRVKRLLVPDEKNVIEVDRGGKQMIFEVVATKAAYYSLVVVPSSDLTLRSDGDTIWLSVRLVESMRTPEDLAFICAYALSKNVMRHSKKRGTNSFLGQVVDMAAAVHGVNTGGLFGSLGQKAYQAGFEVEADLIALFLLASTGYNIREYPVYWEDALRAESKGGFLTKTNQNRVDLMYEIIEAIEEKIAAGEEIYPEAYLSGDTTILKMDD